MRFSEDLAKVWPEGARADAPKLGVAVSGGPDSLALMLLAHGALGGRVMAATVDHGLRSESGAEAAEVALVCAGLGLDHAVLRVDVGEGNVQSQARAARYAALADWAAGHGVSAIATAHHADDQAETLMMRLNRGSGVAGLAGVRGRGFVPGTRLPLLRPLLGWRRAQLAAVVDDAGLRPADDPSNRNEAYDRVRMRGVLAEADWLDVEAVARSAAHLADADAALDWAAGREWAECVRREGLGMTYRPQAPRAVAMRVLGRILVEMGEAPARGGAIARLIDQLLARQPASIGGLVARALPGGWSFSKAPKRRG